jgi:hypothetical protein
MYLSINGNGAAAVSKGTRASRAGGALKNPFIAWRQKAYLKCKLKDALKSAPPTEIGLTRFRHS